MGIRCLIATVVALLFIPATGAWSGEKYAGPDEQCMTKLDSKVHPGEWIRVTSQDGDKSEGRLKSVDFAHLQLMMTPVTDTGTPERAYDFNEIEKLQYHRKGKIKPLYLVGGFVLGAIIGGNIGSSVAQSDGALDFSELEGGLTGAAVGGGVGLIAGTVISVSTNSTSTIRCR